MVKKQLRETRQSLTKAQHESIELRKLDNAHQELRKRWTGQRTQMGVEITSLRQIVDEQNGKLTKYENQNRVLQESNIVIHLPDCPSLSPSLSLSLSLFLSLSLSLSTEDIIYIICVVSCHTTFPASVSHELRKQQLEADLRTLQPEVEQLRAEVESLRADFRKTRTDKIVLAKEVNFCIIFVPCIHIINYKLYCGLAIPHALNHSPVN